MSLIDSRSDRSSYKQLADIWRAQILACEFAVGAPLPSEAQATREYRVGREVVRQAIAILRAEGLVDTSRGTGTTVRAPTERIPVRLNPGDRVTVRMPTDPECDRDATPQGVPLVEIRRTDGTTDRHRRDRVELVCQP